MIFEKFEFVTNYGRSLFILKDLRSEFAFGSVHFSTPDQIRLLIA